MSDSTSGLFSMDPDTARNLLMFGASTMAAANQRTPQGFLANGAGPLGSIGQGLLGMNQGAMQTAQLRSQLGYQGAQTQQLQNQNRLMNLEMPYIQGAINGANGADQSSGAPQATNSSLPMIPRDNTQTAGMQGHNPENLMYAGQPGATGTISLPGGRNLAAFSDNQSGVAAAAQQLMTNQDQHGVSTVRQMVTRWVGDPKADLTSYIGDTSKALGVGPDDPVNWHDPQTQASFLRAQYPHESAGGSSSLQDADIIGGVRRANSGGSYQIAQAGNGPVPAPGQGQPQQAGSPQQGGSYDPATAMANARALYAQAQSLPVVNVAGMGDINQARREAALAQAKAWQDLAMAGPKAGAEAQAKADVDLRTIGPITLQKTQNSPLELRQGGMVGIPDGKGGFTYVKNPSLEKITNPDGSEGWVHITPPLPGSPEGTAGQSTPVLGANNQPAVAKISPQQTEFLEERGKGLAEQFQKIDSDAGAAVQNNYLFDNMRADSQTWDMNKFADWEGKGRAYLKAIAQTFNVATPQLDQKIADFTAFSKSSGMLLREAVHDTSSRAAVQEYKLIGESLPTPTTTKESFEQIGAQWQGLSDYKIAKQKFAQGYSGNPTDFNVAFNSSMSPTSFMLNRMSQTPEGQQTMQGMLSRMQQTPEGRMLAGRMLQQYQYAKSNGYFDSLPQAGGNQ